MAKLKASITDYASASNFLAGKTSKMLGNNTYVRRLSEDVVAVTLHGTDIATFYEDGRSSYYTGGWPTVTTRDRINQLLPDRWYVCQRNHEQYIGDRNNDHKLISYGRYFTFDGMGNLTTDL